MGNDFIFMPYFFHHRIFYNGEQIFLNKKNIEAIKLILQDNQLKDEDDLSKLVNFETFRKVLGSSITNDSLFSCGDEEIDKNEENRFSILGQIDGKEQNYMLINIYNKNYSLENKINPSFNFSEFEELEKNEKFRVLGYPEKKAEDYCSIVIFGPKEECNMAFIDGFLNFLFDINEDCSYRLKLVPCDNEEENENVECLISIRYICSEKGNFKFICINKIKNFDEDDLEKFSECLKKEKYINLFLFNQSFLMSFELNNQDILHKILNSNEFDKYAAFFACPFNSFQIQLKLLFLQENLKYKDKFELIRYMFDNGFINAELIKETIIQVLENDERLREHFISCSFDFNSIFYENKDNKSNLFLYKLTMEGYSYFYNIVTDRKKNNIFVDISSFTNDNFKELVELYKFNVIKQKKIEMKKVEKMIEQKKDKRSNLQSYEDELDNITRDININRNNLSLFVPNNSTKIKINNNKKTMVCNICKFNCHENCNDSNKTYCKSFKFNLKNLKCTKCPNRCSIENHELVSYKYKNAEYKTIKEILEGNFEIETLEKNYESMSSTIREYESKIGKNKLIFFENKKFDKQNLKWYEILLFDIFNYKEEDFSSSTCQIF